MTSLLAHGVRLALVLGHAGVNVLHDIRADRSTEDGRDGVGRARGLTIFADDRDGRSGSHCEGIRRTLTCEKKKKGMSALRFDQYFRMTWRGRKSGCVVGEKRTESRIWREDLV